MEKGGLRNEPPGKIFIGPKKRTAEVAAPGGGYIISSSNSIHPGCRPENYIAMVEAVHQYGDVY
jgi:uroporphyrinogen-III decarboxylase